MIHKNTHTNTHPRFETRHSFSACICITERHFGGSRVVVDVAITRLESIRSGIDKEPVTLHKKTWSVLNNNIRL